MERIPGKMKRRKTEEKAAAGRMEKLPGKMTWQIEEGTKEDVARVVRIPRKMKGRKTEEKKEAMGGRWKDKQKR